MLTKIPAWLDAPAAPKSSPPVVTRAQVLPLKDLSWQDFERLILRLARKEGNVLGCHLYGELGQAQHGIDILSALTDSSQVCYQCKKVTSFTPAGLKKAVTTFLAGQFQNTAKRLIICTSFSFTKTKDIEALDRERRRLATRGVALDLWDGSPASSLMEKLKASPSLVDEFFSRPWVEEFNGREAAANLAPRPAPVDTVHLRERLKTLYVTLFSQHDPGPVNSSRSSPNFKYRYADASVKEQLEVGFDKLGELSSANPTQSEEQEELAKRDPSSPRKPEGESAQRGSRETNWNCLDWIRGKTHSIILGEPGYGKSAFLRYLCLALLNSDASLDGKLDPMQIRLLPVWMSFAGFASSVERNNALSVEDYFNTWLRTNGFGAISELLLQAIRAGEVLLLVDGLDEAPSGTTHVALDRLVTYVASIDSSIICTSRPRGFARLGAPTSWPVSELNPFDDSQILNLANRWFAVSDHEFSNDESFKEALLGALPRAEEFLGAVRINARTHTLARTPLLCKALLEMYRTQSRLPENRAALYEEMVTVMLSRHPTSRVRASGAATGTGPGRDPQDVKTLLQVLALEFQDRLRSVSASRDVCVEVCAQHLQDGEIGLGLDRPSAIELGRSLVDSFVEVLGVLVERNPGELAFVHLTFQEYLAAAAVSARSELAQSEWVGDVWDDERNRESLFAWFGIQRNRSNRGLAGQAASLIDAAGDRSPYSGLKSLEILCALACSDLGLPIVQAREIVRRSGRAAFETPYLQHAIQLASHLTIGALDSQVQGECAQIVSALSSGASPWSRARAVGLMANWRPADDLLECLIQGLKDPERQVRAASALSLVAVFPEDSAAHTKLAGIATCDQRPETRASAIRALKLMPKAQQLAIEAVRQNAGSNHPEVVLEYISTRVDQNLADDHDLNGMFRLYRMSSYDSDWWKQFYQVLEKGWPSNQRIRDELIKRISNRFEFGGHSSYPAIYLMHLYPMDDEIAQAIATSFIGGVFGSPLVADEVWPTMREAYGQHPLVRLALRNAMDKHRETSRVVHWHPSEIGGYLVLGGDDVRDLLIDAYGTEADGFSSYWIAKTLWDGWKDDEVTRAAFNRWIRGSSEEAAPLSHFVEHFIKDPGERREWLEGLVRLDSNRLIRSTITMLLRDFPDQDSFDLVRNRLLGRDIWYYARTELEPLLASLTLNLAESQSVLSAALVELDGPEISPFVAVADHHPSLRPKILRYVTSGRPEIRRVIASVLQERRATEAQIAALVPSFQQDDLADIRTRGFVTVARAVRDIPERRAALVEFALDEVKSNGTHMDARRLSGISIMLELKEYTVLASALIPNRAGDWTSRISGQLHPDSEALKLLLQHWLSLRDELVAQGWEGELPIAELVRTGYGPELEQTGFFTKELLQLRKVDVSGYGERERLVYLSQSSLSDPTFADSLRGVVLGEGPRPRPILYATRILSQNLPTEEEELKALFYELQTAINSHGLYRGQIGYFAINSKSARFRDAVVGLLPEEEDRWGPLDSLLVSAAVGDERKSEAAALSILSASDLDWSGRLEDLDALREWARSDLGKRVLHRWLNSSDGTPASCALTLLFELAEVSADEAGVLLERFNTEAEGTPPQDGLDISQGKICSLAVSVYDAYLYRAIN